MKKWKTVVAGICTTAGIIVLIVDSQTACNGALEGIRLCLQTVIPSLFPLMVLSGLIVSFLGSTTICCFPFLSRFCGIPKGSEIILLTGLVGGYPIGAQCVCKAYTDGKLTYADARRMMGFCSNAGPAFIIGMAGSLFTQNWVMIIVWAIQIVSALTVANVFRGKNQKNYATQWGSSFPFSIRNCVASIGIICGWIVLFRVLLSYLDIWFLAALPGYVAAMIKGFIELSCGCIQLHAISSEFIRFIICNCMLSFGGVCVWMQTKAVVGNCGMGMYLPGKLLQTLISGLLSVLVGLIIFI